MSQEAFGQTLALPELTPSDADEEVPTASARGNGAHMVPADDRKDTTQYCIRSTYSTILRSYRGPPESLRSVPICVLYRFAS